MKYNIKLSKGKININGKEYDIPDEVAKFIIYETSTRDDIIQTRDKAIEYIEKHSFFVEETGYNKKIGYPIETYNAQEILDILKEVE